ncbi:hypothetical protein RHMOL_Rhmol05G0164000 [Rhododendron molle]|uniref:Uncharacterized protein n=1 Tax=Rhododendron molle TaxID=49168 RepID=A0ACC0NRS1_RHOML|nr:hypothetical protein RHMOL_Rhmol05G0164000 [Rhododendron molle]
MRLAYALSFLSLSILATIAVLYLHRRLPFSPISVAVRHSLLPFLSSSPSLSTPAKTRTDVVWSPSPSPGKFQNRRCVPVLVDSKPKLKSKSTDFGVGFDARTTHGPDHCNFRNRIPELKKYKRMASMFGRSNQLYKCMPLNHLGPRMTRHIGLKSMGQPSFQTENVSGGEGDPKSHGSETRWTGLSTNHHRDSHAHCVDKKDIIEENVPEVRQKHQVQERICKR